MKHFIIEEKFTGYANITIEAESEEQALALYNRGQYNDYDMDDMFYDYEFCSIAEEKDDIFIDINETGGKY